MSEQDYVGVLCSTISGLTTTVYCLPYIPCGIWYVTRFVLEAFRVLCAGNGQ